MPRSLFPGLKKPSGDEIVGRRTAEKITLPWLFPYFCLCGFCNLEWTLINEDPDPQQSFLSLIESPLPFFYTSSPLHSIVHEWEIGRSLALDPSPVDRRPPLCLNKRPHGRGRSQPDAKFCPMLSSRPRFNI